MNRGIIYASIRQICQILNKINASLTNSRTQDDYARILLEKKSELIRKLVDLKVKYQSCDQSERGRNFPRED